MRQRYIHLKKCFIEILVSISQKTRKTKEFGERQMVFNGKFFRAHECKKPNTMMAGSGWIFNVSEGSSLKMVNWYIYLYYSNLIYVSISMSIHIYAYI